MSTPSERLKQARLAAGYPTAKEASARVGVAYYSYAQHENGTRGIRPESAELYARAFNVEPEWILYNRRRKARKGIPIIGRVGAGAEGEFADDFAHGAADDWLTPSADEDQIALIVEGHSMAPLAHPGDTVVFGRRYDDPRSLIGRRVMARLTDGRKLFKILRQGSREGLYTLFSLNSAYDPIEDVTLEWALPFERLYARS